MSIKMISEIIKALGPSTLKKLQKRASKVYPELKDDSLFNDWINNYAIDSIRELLTEYDIDVE